MAEAGTAAPSQSKLLATSDVSARLQQALALLFPSNLAAKAALFAVVVALLPLLPSTQQAPRIWELPHLLLLGIVISYGVFGQKNADAEVAADEEPSVEAYVSEMMQRSFAFEQNDRDGNDDVGDNGGANNDGVQAWSSQYLPDDSLVVIADNMNNDGNGDASENPLHLPVRKLKPADEVPATTTLTGGISDGIEDEESREFLAPKAAGYDTVRERAIRSPSSVLDADLTLSPPSPPPPPPPPPSFLVTGRRFQKPKARSFNEFGAGDRSVSGRLGLPLRNAGNKQQFRSKSAINTTRTAFSGYDPDCELDEMVAAAASDSSFSSDDMFTDNDNEEISHGEEEEEEDDRDSCDEELFELATRRGPEADDEVEDEVDRKAEEFIAKFRDQIRMQRVEPARR